MPTPFCYHFLINMRISEGKMKGNSPDYELLEFYLKYQAPFKVISKCNKRKTREGEQRGMRRRDELRRKNREENDKKKAYVYSPFSPFSVRTYFAKICGISANGK
jgi:hypothetical protein